MAASRKFLHFFVKTLLSDCFYDDDEDLESSDDNGERIIQPPHRADIVEEFPDFFPMKGKMVIQVPNGWLQFTKNALRVFASTGMKVKIKAITPISARHAYGHERCRLAVRTIKDDTGGAQHILNEILGESKNLCVVCGRSTKDCALPLCHECIKDLEV